MKKWLFHYSSFLLILIIIISVFSILGNALELDSNTDFLSRVNQMIEENDEDIVLDSNSDEIILRNRLIVKTSSPLPNTFGAVDYVNDNNGLYVLQYLTKAETENAFICFDNLDSIDYVEYDFTFITNINSNAANATIDDLKNKSWGSNTVNRDFCFNILDSCATNWDTIKVAVIDTGLDTTHSFFHGRVEGGYDFLAESNSVIDDRGHGTKVSGIIVNNTKSNVKISPYKTIDSFGYGNYIITCKAIEYAVNHNADIIHMSLGWEKSKYPNAFSTFEVNINYAFENNIPVIVSAGNDYSDASIKVPASNTNVITVSSINENKNPLIDSNYGEHVDVSAPGNGIITTYPNNSYIKDSGTSMAAPFVSAAAAVLKTVIPGITPQQIKDRLKNTAYVPPGWDTNYGAGIVDFKAMLADKMTSPPTITIVGNSAIITAESGATIYYTTDKKDPTVESTVYSEPISTANIKELRAIAVKSNLLPSEPTINIFERDIDVNVIVNKTKTIDFPEGMTARYINNKNPEIAILSADGTVEGFETGEATAIVYFGNNHSAVYHIHVDYHPFIKFLRIVFFWLFWIIDLFK